MVDLSCCEDIQCIVLPMGPFEGLRSKWRVKRFRVEVEIRLLNDRTMPYVQRLQVEITQVSSYMQARAIIVL